MEIGDRDRNQNAVLPSERKLFLVEILAISSNPSRTKKKKNVSLDWNACFYLNHMVEGKQDQHLFDPYNGMY